MKTFSVAAVSGAALGHSATRGAEPTLSRIGAGVLRAVTVAVAVLSLVGAGSVQGQPVSFSIAQPPGQVDFKHLWDITLHNPARDTSSVSFRVEAREAKAGAVFSASTQQIAVAPGERRLAAQDIKLSDVWCKKGYEAFAAPGSLLPEGDYTYSITLDPKMPQTAFFLRVRVPKPAELIWPSNSAVVGDSQPLFAWKPAVVSGPQVAYRYVLRVAEVARGQNGTTALRRNRPVFEERRLPATVCRVPAGVFEPGKTYAWRVGVSDTAGVSVDTAHTQSQTSSFVYKPGAIQAEAHTSFTFPHAGRSVTGYASLVVESDVPDAELCVLEYSLGSDSARGAWRMVGSFPKGQGSFVGMWASDSAVLREGMTFPSPGVVRATVLSRRGQRGEAQIPLVINPPPPPTRKGCGCCGGKG